MLQAGLTAAGCSVCAAQIHTRLGSRLQQQQEEQEQGRGEGSRGCSDQLRLTSVARRPPRGQDLVSSNTSASRALLPAEQLPASASAAKVSSSSTLQLVARLFHALSLLGVEVTTVRR